MNRRSLLKLLGLAPLAPVIAKLPADLVKAEEANPFKLPGTEPGTFVYPDPAEPEFINVMIDSQDRVLFGMRRDGTYVFPEKARKLFTSGFMQSVAVGSSPETQSQVNLLTNLANELDKPV